MTGPSVSAPRFDWYAATVNVGVDDLRAVLCRDLRGTAAPEEGQRNGYHHREVVRNLEGQTVATILHGGNGDIPHAFASSDHAHDFAGIIRNHWPDRHRVSRMDACLDFDGGPATWPDLLELAQRLALGGRVEGDLRKRASKIRTNYMGDWLHGVHGRTFGMGSYKSDVYSRLYEKGIQVREEAAKRRQPVPVGFTEHAVRLEVQVRPAGASKTTAATASPLEAFGYAEWTRELLRRVDGANVPRVEIRERRAPDLERALQWMVRQYGDHLLTEVARLGSWEALGADLRRRLETSTSGDAHMDADDLDTPF